MPGVGYRGQVVWAVLSPSPSDSRERTQRWARRRALIGAYPRIDVDKSRHSVRVLDIAAGVVFKVDLGNELDAINWLLERSGESALDSDAEPVEPIGVALVGSEIYESLIAILGIEPKTAAALVTAAENSLFKSRRGLASCCRVAPADNRSGTNIRSTSPQHGATSSSRTC